MQEAYNDPAQLDQVEFLEVIGALREEVQSMGSDVRDVLRENEELKEEVSRLKHRRRNAKPSRSNMRQIKQDCLEGLDRLNELAAETRGGGRSSDDGGSGPWMKKMMMFMMMADLV